MDGIFYWTGKGLNWDTYGHNPASSDPLAKLPCTPDANGYNTRRSNGDQLLRVVPGPQQAAAESAVRRCRRRRSGHAARPEHLHQRRLVRRQPLSRARTRPYARHRAHRHHSTFRHDRESPTGRSRLCLHVALAQRARDHHQQYLPGRNDDDDARRFPGISDRRVELSEEKSDAIQLLSKQP